MEKFFFFSLEIKWKMMIGVIGEPLFFISPDYAGPPDSKKSNLDIPNRFLSWWKNNTCLPTVAPTKWRGCRWEDPNRQSFVIAREIESVSKKDKKETKEVFMRWDCKFFVYIYATNHLFQANAPLHFSRLKMSENTGNLAISKQQKTSHLTHEVFESDLNLGCRLLNDGKA